MIGKWTQRLAWTVVVLAAIAGVAMSFVRRPTTPPARVPSVRAVSSDRYHSIHLARLEESRGRWVLREQVDFPRRNQTHTEIEWPGGVPHPAKYVIESSSALPGMPRLLTAPGAEDVLVKIDLRTVGDDTEWSGQVGSTPRRPGFGPFHRRVTRNRFGPWPLDMVRALPFVSQPSDRSVLLLGQCPANTNATAPSSLAEWRALYAASVDLAARGGRPGRRTVREDLLILGMRVPMPEARAAFIRLAGVVSGDDRQDAPLRDQLALARLLAGDLAAQPDAWLLFARRPERLPLGATGLWERGAYLAQLLAAVDDADVRAMATRELLESTIDAYTAQQLADAARDGRVELSDELAARVDDAAPWSVAWHGGLPHPQKFPVDAFIVLLSLLIAMVAVPVRARRPSQGAVAASFAVVIGIVAVGVQIEDADWDRFVGVAGWFVAAIGAGQLARVTSSPLGRVAAAALGVAACAHGLFLVVDGETLHRVGDAAAAVGIVSVTLLAATLVRPLERPRPALPRRPARGAPWRLGVSFCVLAAAIGFVRAQTVRLWITTPPDPLLDAVAFVVTEGVAIAVMFAALITWRQALRDGAVVRMSPPALVLGLAAPLAFTHAAALTQLARGLHGSVIPPWLEGALNAFVLFALCGGLFRLHDAARVRARIEIAGTGRAT